ncbi:hypothetical protein CXB51_003144 [Gossypium anomalum]|uniref:PIN domain-containing protein n=1 Tax=Gossypium anomalum TaxID=47600 RepID=A0A8J5Z6W1_9ROSI|nr:hypothetical protein CXB51_003144 [Gossypium anomalum]
MGKAKKAPKFAGMKKIVTQKAIKQQVYKDQVLNPNKDISKEKLPRNVPNVSSAIFFTRNTSLGPPYRVLVDTNFNFSIQNKLDLVKGMVDCLYAKCELWRLCILLRSATKITHKAQSVTSLASKWHVCATLHSFDEGETLRTPAIRDQQVLPHVGANGVSEGDDPAEEEDELDNCKLIPAYAYSTISYHKRQALVTYFEKNQGGITVYGIALDRSTGIEFSFVLWILGKTIGIS